jgi:single-strand DNA-binding protein
MDTRLRLRSGESLRELKGCFIRKVQLPATVGVGKRMLIRRTVQADATPQTMRPIGVHCPHPVEAGLIGNLTREVELRYTPDGRAVATIAVAQTARRQSDTGWVDGPTSYYTCTVWGPMAEHAAESLNKGDRVLLAGRITELEFELSSGPRAGEKVRRHEIVIDEIAVSLRFATAKPVKARRSEQPVGDETAA